MLRDRFSLANRCCMLLGHEDRQGETDREREWERQTERQRDGEKIINMILFYPLQNYITTGIQVTNVKEATMNGLKRILAAKLKAKVRFDFFTILLIAFNDKEIYRCSCNLTRNEIPTLSL